MRVDSILAINNTEKNKHNSAQHTGTSAGRRSSGINFQEYLNAHIQQASIPKISHQSENQLAGLLSGYFTQLKVTQKDEAKPVNAVS